MMLPLSKAHALNACAAVLLLGLVASAAPAQAEDKVTIGAQTYLSKGLVAVGRIPANQRDKYGETFGSGSGMALDAASWKRNGETYSGTVYLLPDRGYNVEGTTDYHPRVNKLSVELQPVSPDAGSSATNPQTGLRATIADTILLSDDKGADTTGLDPDSVRPQQGKLPVLPQGQGKLSLDTEAIVHLQDGSMLISDEYGPYIYHFDGKGGLLSATQPPAALLPMRKGEINFSSNNPGKGQSAPDPKDPESGRQNNQGLEGLSQTPDGKFAIAVLQSATRQDGGDSGSTRNHTRALVYDATNPDALTLVHEYVVPLPTFTNAKGKKAVAAQSEILALSNQSFLMITRDSNAGSGLKEARSLYREVNLVDLSTATDIAGTGFDADKPVAPKGVLDTAVKPAVLTPFIDLNDTAQLSHFGLHNGEPNDKNNLSEKWEAMAVASVLDPKRPDDYFLFIANDNDFLTQDGYQAKAAYKGEGGGEVDTMFLVYEVTLPGLSTAK